MPIAPVPRLILCIERSTGTTCIASWQLPTDDALDVTPNVAGIDDSLSWAMTWAPQEGPAAMTTSVPMLFGVDNVTATTTTRYLPAGYSLGSAPANVLQYRMPKGGTLRDLRIRHNNPQGNGEPIVYTVRINGVPTALFVSIPSTDADASNLVDTVAVAVDDLIDIEVTKANGVGTSPMEITASLLLDP